MWLRQAFRKGCFKLKHLPTEEMPADRITKNLTRQQFEHLVKILKGRRMKKEAVPSHSTGSQLLFLLLTAVEWYYCAKGRRGFNEGWRPTKAHHKRN